MKKPLMTVTIGLTVITALLLALWIYADRSITSIEQQSAGLHTYERHYALISTDTSALWQSIYEGAVQAGHESDAYVEWIGQELTDRYTVEDYLQIASAMQVDGILLRVENTPEMTELIDEATEQGIAVVTILDDDSTSMRVSFVGLNSYDSGEFYGRQILDCLEEGENQVMLLVGSTLSTVDTDFSVLYSRMLQVVDQECPSGSSVYYETKTINTSSSFDVEEEIRDLFTDAQETPNILISLDLTSTECAMQVVVDKNEVGSVHIIGYYASESVLEAIQKGVVKATLGIEGAHVGQLGVEALDEYLELGNVNNYFNVSPELIDADNVSEYMRLYQEEQASVEETEITG